MAIDSVNSNSGLYFSAAQMTQLNSTQQKKTEKTKKTKKFKFSKTLEKTQEEYSLIQEGFPPEIAQMETEEAAIFLRDQVDVAGDKLAENQLPENFANYRKQISLFFKFLEKNNFEVTKKEVRGFSKSGKPMPPKIQIRIINQKLDEMARYLLSAHREKILMLSKINEIKGLLVDLLAN